MKISVAMCTYNGEQFLKEQLDSIINQTLLVDEIIVCDDCSTDKTLDILDKYDLENPNLFKIHKNEINLRSVKNFEKSVGLCSGDFIFLSDQDDIWVDNKVEKMIEYFNLNPNINVLATNGFCIDDKSIVHEKYAVWDVPEFMRENGIEVNYFKIISYVSNIATGASMAFRKKIVRDILPFPIIKNFHHDEWIAIVSSYTNSFELLNDKLFYYRMHENQQVGGVFCEKNELKKKLFIELFNIDLEVLTLKAYKIKLKKYCASFKKNKKLIPIKNKHIDFNNVLNDIELNFNKTKINFKSKSKIKYYFISFTDQLLKKRILK